MKPLRFVFFASLLSIVGCKDKEEIKVYRISKAEAESPVAAGSMPNTGSTAAMPEGHPGMGTAGSQLPADHPSVGTPAAMVAMAPAPSAGFKWTAPAHWQEQKASSMRLASFQVSGKEGASADVSVVVLAGAAGGVLDNVNRWLNQLGQPPITDQKLKAMTTEVPSSLGKIGVVDLQGLPSGADASKDGRILAGMLPNNGETLFFKMRGNAGLVAAEKQNFLKWISSVHPEEQKTAAPETAVTMVEPPTTQSGQPKFHTPEGWQSKPASSMRFASFSTTGPNGEAADISVSAFPGDTGGDLANVNRWRGQVGLEAISEADLKTQVSQVTSKAGPIKVVRFQGPKTHMLAGWIARNGSTWFFKISGPGAVVDAQKTKFNHWLETVEFAP